MDDAKFMAIVVAAAENVGLSGELTTINETSDKLARASSPPVTSGFVEQHDLESEKRTRSHVRGSYSDSDEDDSYHPPPAWSIRQIENSPGKVKQIRMLLEGNSHVRVYLKFR